MENTSNGTKPVVGLGTIIDYKNSYKVEDNSNCFKSIISDHLSAIDKNNTER